MAKVNPTTNETGKGLYPIRTVSELTGVNAITMRAWENRYGLIQPIRKASGHRLYTQEHIDLINRVVGLLDRGMRIGQVRQFLESERSADSQEANGDRISAAWRRYLDGMIAAIIRFDETALDRVYNEVLSHHDTKTVTAKLITPLLVELGERWESGLGTIAEEHFFGFYLRNKLGARFHHRNKNISGAKILMACMPGERHEVGLLLFALAANDAGYQPIILGADMPLEEINAAAAKTGSAAIVLAGLIEPGSNILKKQLPGMADEAELPVLAGGQMSVRVFDALKRMGIEPMGTDVDMAIKRLEELAPLGA